MTNAQGAPLSLVDLGAIDDPRALLEGIFAHSPTPYQIYDPSGRSLLVNAAFAAFFGSVPPPEYNIFNDEIVAQAGLLPLIQQAFAGETVVIRSLRYDPRQLKHVHVQGGREVVASATMFPLFRSSGELHFVVVALRDETAEHAEMEKAEAARADLQAITDQAPDVILKLTPDGTIIFSNREQSELSGKGLMGSNWLSHVPDERRYGLDAVLRRVVATKKAASFEVTQLGLDGKPVWYSCHLGPIIFAGVCKEAVLVARNITGAKLAEAQLIAAERLASVGMVVAGIAHEINNPLASIMANVAQTQEDLEELRMAYPISQDLIDQLSSATLAAERVRRIVKDLRIFSRGDDDRNEPVLVSSVIEATVRIVLPEIRHRAKLTIVNGEQVPLALGNETRIGQVILNLVVNAAQSFSVSGAEENEIIIATAFDAAQQRVLIRVVDTGCGIPEELHERVFTPFFTTKTSADGTGLGLSICHRIVTALGGEIAFTSVVGKGTEFRVFLPAVTTSP